MWPWLCWCDRTKRRYAFSPTKRNERSSPTARGIEQVRRQASSSRSSIFSRLRTSCFSVVSVTAILHCRDVHPCSWHIWSRWIRPSVVAANPRRQFDWLARRSYVLLAGRGPRWTDDVWRHSRRCEKSSAGNDDSAATSCLQWRPLSFVPTKTLAVNLLTGFQLLIHFSPLLFWCCRLGVRHGIQII